MSYAFPQTSYIDNVF